MGKLFSGNHPISYAEDDDHDWGHHGHGYYREHYYPQPQINYYPPPQVNYYPEPQVEYYPQQHRYSGYDQRSHQGLAGGVLGSVFGYEIGSGDPVAAGLGAVAGSFFGNGMGGR